jgi:hypothetical protein
MAGQWKEGDVVQLKSGGPRGGGVGRRMKSLKPREFICRRQLPALQDNRAEMEKSGAQKSTVPPGRKHPIKKGVSAQ